MKENTEGEKSVDKQNSNNNNNNSNPKNNKNAKPTSTGSKKKNSAGGDSRIKEKGLFYKGEHSPSDDIVDDDQTSSIDDDLNLRAALYGLLFQTYADTVRNEFIVLKEIFHIMYSAKDIWC